MPELQSSPNTKTAAIIAKALEDDGYREELLVNPRHALQSEFGKELPLGLEVRVVEESPKVVYLVLPPKPQVELTDDELVAVAGGFSASSSSMKTPRTGWYPLDEWLATVLA